MPFTSLPSPSSLLFPTFLVPSLPFRRRQSSTDSNASSTSSVSTASAPSYLNGHASHLRCAKCSADLALANQIISKGFTGRHGRAYLVAAAASALSADPRSLASARARSDALPNLPNTYAGKPVPRQLVTGAHTVSDISCSHCGTVLGWKYVAAEEEAQRYKVGKFILETKKVCRSSTWEVAAAGAGGDEAGPAAPPRQMPAARGDDEVEFDSQDEDECEDLFLGIWTPRLASKRRRAKKLGKADG